MRRDQPARRGLQLGDIDAAPGGGAHGVEHLIGHQAAAKAGERARGVDAAANAEARVDVHAGSLRV